MDWLWLLGEVAGIAVAFVALSLLAIRGFFEARYRLRMRFDPEYRRRREMISHHVSDIVRACDELETAYRKAAAQEQKEPVLRLHMPIEWRTAGHESSEARPFVPSGSEEHGAPKRGLPRVWPKFFCS